MNPQPVGLATDLAPLQVMRSTVGQHDIAVWRSASGVVCAWENRCPHRGMRLSYGFVRGESLACAYHGWHYNCSGQCHYIPAHPELTPPKSIRPMIFGVTEHAGLLWVDTSRVDTSRVDTSRVDTSRVDTSRVDTSRVDTSRVDTSNESQPSKPGGGEWVESLTGLPQDLQPLRTLSIDCKLDALIGALANAPSPGNPSIKAVVKSVSEQVRILCIDAMNTISGVYLVLHAPPAQPVFAHVLVHSNFGIEDRILISRWCESLRRRVENL